MPHLLWSCCCLLPARFAEDASDNPNKGLGILNGCAEGQLFTTGTWNADFCDPMKPKDGDVRQMCCLICLSQLRLAYWLRDSD